MRTVRARCGRLRATAFDNRIEDIKAGRGDIDGDSAFLGVSTSDIDEQPADVLAQANVLVDEGAFVVGVQPGTAAETAGLADGDVIVAIDGQSVAGKCAFSHFWEIAFSSPDFLALSMISLTLAINLASFLFIPI